MRCLLAGFNSIDSRPLKDSKLIKNHIRVTRCSDQKVANILAKIAKFVATVKKKNSNTKISTSKHQFLAIFGGKSRQSTLKIAKMTTNRHIWSH